MNKIIVGTVYESNEHVINQLKEIYKEVEVIDLTKRYREGINVDLIIAYSTKEISGPPYIKLKNLNIDEDIFHYYYSNIPTIFLGNLTVVLNYFENNNYCEIEPFEESNLEGNYVKGTGIFNRYIKALQPINNFLLIVPNFIDSYFYSEKFNYRNYNFRIPLTEEESHNFVEAYAYMNKKYNKFYANCNTLSVELLKYILTIFKI
jgi:hypothetical protein